MPLEDILLRFRRVWAPPGPVMGQAGVPADLQSRVDDELRELTTMLASIDEEGRSIIQGAEAESARMVARAQADAVGAIAAAQQRAPEVRAMGASARVRDRQAAMDSLLAAARKDAVGLRDRSRERMDEVVRTVVARTFAHVPEEVADVRIVGGG
jgi:hypothetical protein